MGIETTLERAAELAGAEGLRLEVREGPGRLCAVWDLGFGCPVVWGCPEELEEKAADIIRGLRVMRRAGRQWVWRSPRDWSRLLWLGRQCRPPQPWDVRAELRRTLEYRRMLEELAA